MFPYLTCSLPCHGSSSIRAHAPYTPARRPIHTFGDTHHTVPHRGDLGANSWCARTVQVLSCYALMATGAQDQVELAVSQLLEVAAADRDNVPVVLALATGFMLLRQTPKARQALLYVVVSREPHRSCKSCCLLLLRQT